MEHKKTIITLVILALFCCIPAFPKNLSNHGQTQVNNVFQEDFTEYMRTLQEKLQSTWNPPDFMEEGHVKVFFKINRFGELLSTNVIESSGNVIYDESALEAIKDSAPFNKFPENTIRDTISIKYSFDTILIEEERMNGYYELAKSYSKTNPARAIEYLNLAIDKVGGEEASCFLYKRRADLKSLIGDTQGAESDYEKYKLYTNNNNVRRVHLLKHISEKKPTAYTYHYLAYAYEQIKDYDNAILAVDRAIELTDSTALLRRYRDFLISKRDSLN